jgi:hypothetical protein
LYLFEGVEEQAAQKLRLAFEMAFERSSRATPGLGKP